MRVTRIYVPKVVQTDTELQLPDTAVRHVIRSLRLQPGAELTLFDGRGGEYVARLVRTERSEAWVRVEAHRQREAESPLNVTLVQGISRGERMDYAIQKAVELGVCAIAPVFTERSVVQLKGERADKRQSHWQAIAQSACEQCGRNRVPILHAPIALNQWLRQWQGRLGLTLSPGAQTALAELPFPEQPLAVLIGPEGGLTDAEVQFAQQRGFQAVRLGPRVLRTETAAVAVLAAIQTLWGDLR